MKKIIPFPSLFLIVGFTIFFLVGCGGGGGGDDSSPSIPLKTSTIRQLEPGDSWNYSVSGTISDGVTTENITGKASSQILSTLKQSPQALSDCLDQLTVYTITGQDGVPFAFDSHDYFLQNINGSEFHYGEGDSAGEDAWVTFPAEGYYLSMESPVAVGQIHGDFVTLGDGSSYTYGYSVDGIEYVSTPLGYYESYKLTGNKSIDYGFGFTEGVSSTTWFVPGLGMVKYSETDSIYIDQNLILTYQLTIIIESTSVIY